MTAGGNHVVSGLITSSLVCALLFGCTMFSFCVSTSVFWRFCTSWLLDYTSFGFQLFIKACVFVLNPIWVRTIFSPVMGQKTNDFVSLKHRPGASKTNKKKNTPTGSLEEENKV